MARRLETLDDSRLAARVRKGDEAAFEVLYDRHHRALLSFCRHMLGNLEDGEDALQQTFLRAHKALQSGPLPDSVRPWLFAIARNRCKTMLAARREACVPVDEVEPSFDGLAEGVAVRADLRELVADLGRLPDEQRAALVMFELGGLSQAEIAGTIGVPTGKVKALVFQARSELIAERDARSLPCESIREQLAVARGGALRRGPLRRHLRHCEPCSAYRLAVADQRAGLAAILPVAPATGLKATILAAAAGLEGGAVAGGVTALAAKVAAIVALAGAGAGVVVERTDQPAGTTAAAVVTSTPTPTPTPTPSPQPTATATATPKPPPEPKKKPRKAAKKKVQRGRVSEPARAAATATASPAPAAARAAATSTPAPPKRGTVAAEKPAAPSKPRRPPPVSGVVIEEAPTPPPGPVDGEFSEPDPRGAPPAAEAETAVDP